MPLWLPASPSCPPRSPAGRAAPALLTHRPRKRTITMPDGQRALISVDDSGTVKHREHGDTLDAKVLLHTIRMRMDPERIERLARLLTRRPRAGMR